MALVLSELIVRIAVQPALARFGGCDDRMSAPLRVSGCVPVRRAVATERPPALLTRSEMHPVGANLHALVALALPGVLYGRHGCDMRAGVRLHAMSVSFRGLWELSQNAFCVMHRSVEPGNRGVHDLVLKIKVQEEPDAVELRFV